MAILKPKDTGIVPHISPEILQQQNAEFLAAYPTDDAQIDYYTDLAMKLWDEFQIDGSYDVRGTRVNVQTWYESKRAQMERFRQHPYWCEEAKAIIFAFGTERKVNYYLASRHIHHMRDYIYNETRYLPNGDEVLKALEKTFALLHGVDEYCVPNITETFIEHFTSYLNALCAHLPKSARRMLSPGTKLTRFIRKCCEEFEMQDGSTINVMKLEDPHERGDRTFDSVEKRFAKLADALSVLTTTNVAFMSLNFLDFMTMSHGNSWSTCHYINSHGLFHREDGSSSYHGAYKQGCLSYALDEPSFIFYTLPADTKGSAYYRCKKLTRMCCQYANGTLVTGKCYPNNESEVISKYVAMLKEVVAVTEKSIDEWETTTDSGDHVSARVKTADGAAHYADYTMSRQRPTISLCRKLMLSQQRQMTIGHRAYCVYCGKELNGGDGNWLQCSPHRKKMVCAHCGKKLTDDMEFHDSGEILLCGDCAFYCAVHHRIERVDNLYGTILMKDGEVKVCNAAMELLAKCENCGTYGLKENMLRTTNGYSCKKHVRRYKKCALCGVYVLNGEVHVDDNGNIYCDECNDVIANVGAIRTIQKETYSVGDYVVVAPMENVRNCTYGSDNTMRTRYPGRIVKINRIEQSWLNDNDVYVFSLIDNVTREYAWDKDCIACAIYGVSDAFIGKTLEEVRQMMKGE